MPDEELEQIIESNLRRIRNIDELCNKYARAQTEELKKKDEQLKRLEEELLQRKNPLNEPTYDDLNRILSIIDEIVRTKKLISPYESKDPFDILKKENLDKMIQKCKAVIILHPNEAKMYYLLSTLMGEKYEDNQTPPKTEFDKALRLYQKSTELDPTNPIAQSHLGLMLFGQISKDISNNLESKEIKDAESAFEKAVALDPNNPIYHYRLGFIKLVQEKYIEALNSVTNAIRINGTDPDFHSLAGLCLEEDKKFDQAILSYKRAIRLEPFFGEMVHQQMAWSLCENGNLEESIEEIKRLIENNPEEGYNYYMMGHVLSCKGEYDSAIKEYNRAIELDPKNPAYHFLLGTILSKKGQFGSASEEYELAAKLNPPVLLAKEIYERKTKTEKRIGLFYKFRRWFKK